MTYFDQRSQRVDTQYNAGHNIHIYQSPLSLTERQRKRNRARMLERVQAIWITGFLEQSLHRAALITLGLYEQPNAVTNPWRLVLQEMTQPACPLPPGTPIAQVYDETDSGLLILGEPGSGKTTLLLELARNLLDRASHDDSHPMPVMFNLSSWAVKRQPITEWLIEELNTKYQVPRKVGKEWVETDQLLLLLDGLDEVSPTFRSACVDAINTYRQEHGLVPTVVCSRSADYLAQTTRVQLHTAVEVQPLTLEQIDAYLASTNEPLAVLRTAVHEDPTLQELTTTPLMLSVLVMAYQGKSVEDLVVSYPAIRQPQVFTAYVQRMLQRRGAKTLYTPQQIMYWLTWLAGQMIEHNQTEFYIERMQPDWLPDRQSRRLYRSMVGGLLVGLPIGLVIWQFFGLIIGLLIGLLIGPLIGLLSIGKREIKPAEVIVWSWMKMRRDLVNSLVIALVGWLLSNLVWGVVGWLIFGLVGGVVGGLVERFSSKELDGYNPVVLHQRIWRSARKGVLMGLVVAVVEGLVGILFGNSGGLIKWLSGELGFGLLIVLFWWLAVGLVSGLIVGLIFGLVDGFSSQKLDEHYRIMPNQGIRRSARNGVLVGVVVGLLVGLPTGLVIWLIEGLFFRQLNGLVVGLVCGLVVGLVCGLVGGLLNGGTAYIQHMVLRLLLWRTGSIPWNYSRFLDYAAERILLRKVGSGYIFVHRLLLEHFAKLDTLPTPELELSPIQSLQAPSVSMLHLTPVSLPLSTKEAVSSGRAQLTKRRASKRRLWFWIILLLILSGLIGGGIFGSVNGLLGPTIRFESSNSFSSRSFASNGFSSGGSTSGSIFTRSFTVNTMPTIVINNQNGMIRVHPGSTSNTVVIEETKFSGDLNDIPVDYVTNGNTINVNADTGEGSSSSKRVDFDVTVPRNANLQLNTSGGDIDVSGVRGQLSLSSSRGSIIATNDTLSGPSGLKTDSGPITFDGSIDAHGTYQFETQSGSVNVTLPINSTFHLNAKTDSGSINTNDFPDVKVQHTINGSQAHGDVGTNPQAVVTLTTKSGSITLQA